MWWASRRQAAAPWDRESGQSHHVSYLPSVAVMKRPGQEELMPGSGLFGLHFQVKSLIEGTQGRNLGASLYSPGTPSKVPPKEDWANWSRQSSRDIPGQSGLSSSWIKAFLSGDSWLCQADCFSQAPPTVKSSTSRLKVHLNYSPLTHCVCRRQWAPPTSPSWSLEIRSLI